MTLKYYGTAAAEGIPGMFCTCPTCEKARRAGGRNIRSRSQALVDGHLLIDFPADTFMHVTQGLDLPSITALLITHAHHDHLYPSDFENRKPGFAHVGDTETPLESPLRIFASAATRLIIEKADRLDLRRYGVTELHTVEPFVPFDLDGYTVTGLKADHEAKIEPLIYLIEKDGKTLFYANDTGWFLDETWEYLAAVKPQMNFISLDCTGMVNNYRRGHMGIETNLEVRERLLAIGCASEKTLFCHHHFSHNGELTYDEQLPIAEKDGFLVSYDGMEIAF